VLDGADRRRAHAPSRGARLTAEPGAASSWRFPAAASAAALALYLLTCARTVAFGDAGELIAASWRFGVAHPPGYPLYTAVLGAILHLVPLGETALRTNVVSAICAAAATGVIAAWARKAFRSTTAAAAAAGAFATCGIVWSVATITEVYALHALLLVVLLALAWRAGTGNDDASRRRAFLGVSIALGLGLAHHPTIVVALPAVLVMAWCGRRALRARDVAACIGIAVAIPIAADLSLLLRARWDHDAWGGIDSISRLVPHVLASRYRPYDLGWGALSRTEGWKSLISALTRGFAGAGLLAGIGGALLPPAKGDSNDRRFRSALVVLGAAGAAFVLRYATEDPDSYALPIVIAIAMLAGRAVRWLEVRLPNQQARVAGIGSGFLVTALPLLLGWRTHDLSADRAPRLAAEDMLATLPPRAILFADGDDGFLLAYATEALGERPDVTLYDRSGGLFATYLKGQPREAPGAVDEERRMRREIEIATAEQSRTEGHPVFFMGWPGYELPPELRFEPEGLFEHVVRTDAPPGDDGPLWSGYHEREVAASAERDRGAFALSIAATYPLMRGEEALARGRIDDATKEFNAALARSGESETVLNTIGTTWARRGDLRQAAAMFERAAAAKPASLRAWLNLAQAYRMMGDERGAAFADGKARAIAGGGR
jgi:tetratricopeptide (TPR) repeat protein